MDDWAKILGAASRLATIEIRSKYWQVPIANKGGSTSTDRPGIGGFWRMPSDLRNTSATFQRTVWFVLSALNWQSCSSTLDGATASTKAFGAYLEKVDLWSWKPSETRMPPSTLNKSAFSTVDRIIWTVIPKTALSPLKEHVRECSYISILFRREWFTLNSWILKSVPTVLSQSKNYFALSTKFLCKGPLKN